MEGLARIEHTSVLAVCPTQPVLHSKRLAPIKGFEIRADAMIVVLRMYALSPATAKLFFQNAPSEGEPREVDEGAQLVGARPPNHGRRGIGHRAKVLLARAQRLFRAATTPALDHQGANERRLQNDEADCADDVVLVLLEHA